MDKRIDSAIAVLGNSEISVLDAARYIKNILDAKPVCSKLTDAQFVLKVIDVGLRNIRVKEMSFAEGFALYLESKKHLRRDSIRDIRCIGNRLIRVSPEFGRRNFSEFSVSECEEWLSSAFQTPSQFNKARAMLHGLFGFALRRQWCDKNPVKLIERRKIIEKEIIPLSYADILRLMRVAQDAKIGKCAAAAALMIFSGIRPREVRRLMWRDIDFEESSITVRSVCSKTGGVRHVEICPRLKNILQKNSAPPDTPVCPKNWSRHWKFIRDFSGLKGLWVQDVLRHTYASFHAKLYADLPRLQLNMGHCNISLLRARYVNMRGISKVSATRFFKGAN